MKTSSRLSTNKAISQMVISATLLAIALILDFVVNYIPFLNWPSGGSISLAMLPLFLVGFICGPVWGFGISIIFGALSMLIGGAYTYNWCSILLDYILGYGIIGVCGFFTKSFYQKKTSLLISGMIIAALLRFLCSFLSGCIVVWDINPNGSINPNFSSAAMSYSAVYNLGYIFPSLVICIVVFALLAKPLYILAKSQLFRNIAPQLVLDNSDEKIKDPYAIFDSSFISLAIVLLVISILSCIPNLSYEAAGHEQVINFVAFGIISIIFSPCLLGYSIFRTVKSYTSEVEVPALSNIFHSSKGYYLTFSIIFLLTLALAILSMVLNFANIVPGFSLEG